MEGEVKALQELVDKAIDLIIDYDEMSCNICDSLTEMDNDWCAKNCIDTLRKKCVLKYLETYKLEHEDKLQDK